MRFDRLEISNIKFLTYFFKFLNNLLKVTYEEGKEYADSLEIKFIETSAKKANNVDKAFYTMGGEIKNRI